MLILLATKRLSKAQLIFSRSPKLAVSARKMATTNGTTNGSTEKVTLYTNHGCPYAHRAHITLDELKIPYEEVIIDLTVPRPQWYLDINPRGLVPSVKYTAPGQKEEIITESAIVSQFFADLHPSHLMPASTENALKRARINFFVDTWSTKIGTQLFSIYTAPSEEQKEEKTSTLVSAVEKEIEPLLANATPFFDGSAELTFAEVITAPFILRIYDGSADGSVCPKSLAEKLDALPNFGKWAQTVRKHPNVLRIYDGKAILEQTKKRLAKMAAAKQ